MTVLVEDVDGEMRGVCLYLCVQKQELSCARKTKNSVAFVVKLIHFSSVNIQ